MWEGCLPGGSGPLSLTGSSIIVTRAPPALPRRTQLRCGELEQALSSRKREAGAGRRRAARLGLAVCCARACVHACVYCEEACSPMEAGPGAEKLQLRTLRPQLRGLRGPGKG